MVLENCLAGGIVDIYKPQLTALKQQALTGGVFLQAAVLVFSNMVWRKIGENPVIKHKPVGPVPF